MPNARGHGGKWTPDEQTFLLKVAQLVCRDGYAMRFWRTPEDTCIEVEPAYGLPVTYRVVIDGPVWAYTEGGATVTAYDVVCALRKRLRA
jgi:hypothetical protein